VEEGVAVGDVRATVDVEDQRVFFPRRSPTNLKRTPAAAPKAPT
jgi:hypothetical protein